MEFFKVWVCVFVEFLNCCCVCGICKVLVCVGVDFLKCVCVCLCVIFKVWLCVWNL